MRRRLLPLALAAAALPALSRAQTGAGSRPIGGALLGVESANGGGLALRLDASFPQRPLGPGVGLAIVGSVGYAHLSDEQVYFFNQQWRSSVDVFRLAPAVRFTFGSSPSLRPYADAGLGLYFASTNVDYYDYPSGVPIASDHRTDTGLFLRLAGGLMVEVSPTVSLGGEVGATPASGSLDSGFYAMAALSFRL